jgi:hypothetical protein
MNVTTSIALPAEFTNRVQIVDLKPKLNFVRERNKLIALPVCINTSWYLLKLHGIFSIPDERRKEV